MASTAVRDIKVTDINNDKGMGGNGGGGGHLWM